MHLFNRFKLEKLTLTFKKKTELNINYAEMCTEG